MSPVRRARAPRVAVVAAIAALAGAAALTLSACGRELPASALVVTAETAPADRSPMPAVAGTTLDGTTASLAALRGKVVVVNGWASWCAPCQEEIPALVDLASSADPASVAFLGVNVSDDMAAASEFVSAHGIPYPSISDPDGKAWATIPGIPPASLPSTVIVDRDGNIAMTVVGKVNGADLAEAVTRIAAERQ